MVAEIFAEPCVPGFIDDPNSARLRVGAGAALDRRDDTEVDAGKMGVGTKMIADHNLTGSFQFSHDSVGFRFLDLAAPQSSIQLGHEPGLLTAAENLEDGFANLVWFSGACGSGSAIHFKATQPAAVCAELYGSAFTLSNRAAPIERPSVALLKLPRPCANLCFLMAAEQSANPLREIPSLDHLLKHTGCEGLLARYNRAYVTEQCRAVLDQLRGEIRQGKNRSVNLSEDAILERLEQRIALDSQPGHIRVMNATGTILHTNLGRALLSQNAIDAMTAVARHPVNLEYDLAAGKRGKREETLETLLVELTGAEAATVVNNNAAAVLLGLNTLAEGREVIVSRGELIEIGGSFRIPEIMAKSGAILREVGSTNRTHPADYENAITDRTALLLKVHTSNYKVVGFTAEVSLEQMVAIGTKHDLPVMEDLGSGALIDLGKYGLPKEPIVSERIQAGADVVTFSGDKILGGPQAGLMVGKKSLIARMNKNPLQRALRCGKLTLAALEATLRRYRQSTDIVREIPTLRAFTRPVEEIRALGEELAPRLQAALGDGFQVQLQESTAQIGSGALPTEELPTIVITIEHQKLGASAIAQKFRAADPPIIGRISDEKFLLDLRMIFDAEDLMPNWT
jgi:L-seryl-tRNA(Ser) seleniumtransferase